jgi:hypothetical protein
LLTNSHPSPVTKPRPGLHPGTPVRSLPLGPNSHGTSPRGRGRREPCTRSIPPPYGSWPRRRNHRRPGARIRGSRNTQLMPGRELTIMAARIGDLSPVPMHGGRRCGMPCGSTVISEKRRHGACRPRSQPALGMAVVVFRTAAGVLPCSTPRRGADYGVAARRCDGWARLSPGDIFRLPAVVDQSRDGITEGETRGDGDEGLLGCTARPRPSRPGNVARPRCRLANRAVSVCIADPLANRLCGPGRHARLWSNRGRKLPRPRSALLPGP